MRRIFIAIACLLLIGLKATSQATTSKKYPSIFWEITGNGLQKPSYLFGTMHVSNKLAFHLSDSFYLAIQHVDMVALELNPQFWQRDMISYDAAQANIGNFYVDNTNNFLTETSFQPAYYYDNLKNALTGDPQEINSLLYRNFSVQQDFEENTYLDLYIYQTGRKFGKMAGGVEDYYATQKILIDAYRDMVKEKSKKTSDDAQVPADLDKKIQEAYRRGDLDLLDSLEKLSFNSPAYLNKFLYERSSIQANSIDTILKHRSAFIGVGAAHLPGDNGVIEALRKKGYKLRPIFMQDRDAAAKEYAEKLKVPVTFNTVITPDSVVEMKMPGPLYKMQNANTKFDNDTWQYADMENGAYYILTRVKTNAGIIGQDETDVLQKVDSMLYENIPGTIVIKKNIEVNGCKGFDITNKTRRGDMQRYNIIITPVEIIVIKMSGLNDYVNGPEADTFFNSVKIKTNAEGWINFTSLNKGFHVKFPQQPYINVNTHSTDKINRWEYNAVDNKTGNTYSVWEKTVVNIDFIEQDTFDLSLIEQSFKKSEIVQKELSRSFGTMGNYHTLNLSYACKNGDFIYAKAVLKGTQYFLLLESTHKKTEPDDNFFSSFGFNAINYPPSKQYVDTILNFTVKTPVTPTLDSSLSNLTYSFMHDDLLMSQLQSYTYWPKTQFAAFNSDLSGENVLVTSYEYPKYYYAKDSASFWSKQLDFSAEHDAVLYSVKPLPNCNACQGFKIIWRDTNTVREIVDYRILGGNTLYNIFLLQDTVTEPSRFITDFVSSFSPLQKKKQSIYTNKTDYFFKDLYNTDSLTKAHARSAIPNVFYGKDNIDRIASFINNLKYGEEDYFEMKSRFILELGFINDSCCTEKIVKALDTIYKQTADTAYFQNQVIWALANLKTKSSYIELKNLLLQDPPLFDDANSYDDFFNSFNDSLQLAKNLFPEILQLTTIQDYKEPVLSLLKTLLDSNFITARNYDSYFTKLDFDAKIEMKKQQNIEEKLLEKQSQQQYNNNGNDDKSYAANDESSNDLDEYASLLLPFYNENAALPKFYNKLLQSRDTLLQISTAILLLRNNKTVDDSVLKNIASQEYYRAALFYALEKIGRTDLFPSQYKKQELLARSVLLEDGKEHSFSDIKMQGKATANLHGKTGTVYFYEYKINPEDDWQIGLSGLQPENVKAAGSDDELTSLTGVKLTGDDSPSEQFNEQLLKLIFKQHKSAKHFFEEDEGDYNQNDNYNN